MTENDELTSLGRGVWNDLFKKIQLRNLNPRHFVKSEGVPTSSPRIAYHPPNLPHGGTGAGFTIDRNSATQKWNIIFGVPTLGPTKSPVNFFEAETRQELFHYFDLWLSYVIAFERELEREAAPDLWEELLKQPQMNSATIRTPEHEFSQEEVDDFKTRVVVALDEIESRKLLTSEIQAEVQKALEARLPKVGQKWGDWREHFAGWVVGKVLDRVFSQDVVSIILRGVGRYLAVKYAVPQLLP